MRLNVDSSVVGSSTALLVVTGVIDWSTITQFRAILAPHVAGPRSDTLVDLSGLLSWSSPAQAALVGAMTRARLQGGRLAVFGLAAIPAGQARRSGLHRALHPFPTQTDAQADAQAMPAQSDPRAALAAVPPPQTPRAVGRPVAPSEPRRRATSTARWNAQRAQRWTVVNQVEAYGGAPPEWPSQPTRVRLIASQGEVHDAVEDAARELRWTRPRGI
jgi:anti-anti-sigma regulatory factor